MTLAISFTNELYQAQVGLLTALLTDLITSLSCLGLSCIENVAPTQPPVLLAVTSVISFSKEGKFEFREFLHVYSLA